MHVTTKHLPRLDSLRGIAALMVGGFHAGLNGGSTLVGQHVAWILSFFFDGRTGVCIFFVLSGLVLGMSLRRNGTVTMGNYLHFCGRRFFRLYPAYFVSTLFYLLLYAVIRTCLVHGLPIGHGWCDYYSQSAPWSWTHLIANFIFFSQSLNVASWTLKVEAQAAFILPLLHAFSLRFRGKGEVLLLCMLVLLCVFSNSGSTRINLCLFYLGYLIPPLLEILRAARFAEKFENGGWFWLFAMAIAALAGSHLFATSGVGACLGVLMAGLGGTLLLIVILLASSHPIFSILDHRLIKFLGTVSYSFYLFNLLSVDLVERAIYFSMGQVSVATFLNWFIVFSLSSLLCVALASCSFFWVERPAIKLGGFLLPAKSDSSSTVR